MKGQIYSSHHHGRKAGTIRLSKNGSFSYYSFIVLQHKPSLSAGMVSINSLSIPYPILILVLKFKFLRSSLPLPCLFKSYQSFRIHHKPDLFYRYLFDSFIFYSSALSFNSLNTIEDLTSQLQCLPSIYFVFFLSVSHCFPVCLLFPPLPLPLALERMVMLSFTLFQKNK